MGDRVRAIGFHNQGVQLKGQPNSVDLSFQLHCSSVYVDPTFSYGFFECGNAAQAKQQYLAAVAAYRRGLEVPMGENPGDLTPDLKSKMLANLAHDLHHSGQDALALDAANESIAIDSRSAFGWLNKSLAEARFKREEDAVRSAQEAYTIDPSPIVETGFAFALLFNRQYARGLKHFEARFAYQLPQFQAYPYPKWSGEEGATIFLVSEQGIGDAISFVRFIEATAKRCKHVHMAVQPELKRLFAAMFLHMPNIELHALPCEFKAADYWTSFMSLPTALGLSDDEIINATNPPVPAFTMPPNWKAAE